MMITQEEICTGKILIVDDEPANVKLLEGMLKQKGYTSIKSIYDSREALATYQEFAPDLVLLDFNMPHMNGLQVLEQLNEYEKNYYAPVMVLTAQADHGIRLEFLKAGARDFLSKPFDLFEVSLRIKNMLEVRLLNNQMLVFNQLLKEKYEGQSVDLAAIQLKLENEKKRKEEVQEHSMS